MNGKIHSIEIHFPEPVDMTPEDANGILAIVSAMTDRYGATHPGRVMWVFGVGQKMLSNPYMMADDEPMQFDEGCFEITCSERADYKWPCAKCGKPQGDHKGHITEPPAGDCEFTAHSA